MCGRFAMDDKMDGYIEELVLSHGLGVIDDFSKHLPRWNIKPTDDIPVILHSTRLGHDAVAVARWGFIPVWAKSIQAAPRTLFNARSESAVWREDDGRASMWRAPLAKGQRCLVPASGYFEWSGPKSHRTPHWIHPGQGMLAFAGLYGWWTDPARSPDDPGRTRLTATILTMASVPRLASIHDRNPVALPPSAWWDWIDPEVTGDQNLVAEMVAEARPVLTALHEHEVAPFGAASDGPDLVRPAQTIVGD